MEEVLVAKGKQQKELLGNLLEDEKYQRDAFAALFVKQDQTTRQICSQVESIQNELASLSMVEMTKKDLKVSPSSSCSYLVLLINNYIGIGIQT